MTVSTRTRLAAVAMAAAVALAGCGSSGGEAADRRAAATTTTGAADTVLAGSITVSAASSLTGAFDDEIAAFEDANPDTEVVATYDSSSALVDQITSGADVDVFASADEANMEKVTAAELTADDPVVIARNRLVIITKPGNPERIETLADLAAVDGTISLCGADVPCGKFAAQVLEEAEVTIEESSVTRGQNAKATLAAVAKGDAVAGIVYVTDAKDADDDVAAVTIPDDDNVISTLPIAALGDEADPVATAFVAFVRSDEGQAILQEHGFLAPT